MTLKELIIAVKEQNLTKEKLEQYRDAMSHLFADYQLEMADLEKKEALFMNRKTPDDSVAQMKIYWKATTEGQRLIDLKRESLALKELLNSLKSRLYSIY